MRTYLKLGYQLLLFLFMILSIISQVLGKQQLPPLKKTLRLTPGKWLIINNSPYTIDLDTLQHPGARAGWASQLAPYHNSALQIAQTLTFTCQQYQRKTYPPQWMDCQRKLLAIPITKKRCWRAVKLLVMAK
jgi:hypothetical protein